MLLSAFLTVVIVHLLAVVSPGPDFAVITRNSLLYSRRAGILTALGLALGIGIHVTYCLFGIGLVISQSILLFSAIKWFGAVYLVYIGYKSLRSKPKQEEEVTVVVSVNTLSDAKAVRIGFLTNVLNPKATLFFLALFTQVIAPATPTWVQLVYGIEMITMTFVWFSFVSLVFSNQILKRKIGAVQHYIERVTGAVLIALGIKVALSSR
ncbi:MAG: LysE family translocator [Candidatus Taylorbacteria bacterium]|nr:LysE family translocator [Candidatus Taylorbacteria bacterium]